MADRGPEGRASSCSLKLTGSPLSLLRFPSEHFGKLLGLLMALSAIVSLLQFPIFTLIKGPLWGDLFYVNVTLVLFTLLTFVHPFLVYRECWRKEPSPATA